MTARPTTVGRLIYTSFMSNTPLTSVETGKTACSSRRIAFTSVMVQTAMP